MAMRRAVAALLIALCAAGSAVAQEARIIDGVEVVLPAGYGETPPEWVKSDDGGTPFSRAGSRDELMQALAQYSGGRTIDNYLAELKHGLPSAADEQDLWRHAKYVAIHVINVVPDDQFDPAAAEASADAGTLSSVPASQVGDDAAVCANFAEGFEERWGSDSFHVFDEKTGICHCVNVVGAFVALHLKLVDSHIVVVEAVDWPLAFLPDYMNSGQRLAPFDFRAATALEKFAEFRAAANTDDATAILLSARSTSR
jgi:hypothetical protein